MGFTVAAMEAEHAQFAELLEVHQCALLRALADPGAIPVALRAWNELAESLLAHLRFEDSHLIPLFAARVQPIPRGCTPELLHAEHRKIERLLEQIGPQVHAHFEDERESPHSVLQLIEAERTLREVLDHHDQRERSAFFPALDRVMTATDREHFAQLHPSPKR